MRNIAIDVYYDILLILRTVWNVVYTPKGAAWFAFGVWMFMMATRNWT